MRVVWFPGKGSLHCKGPGASMLGWAAKRPEWLERGERGERGNRRVMRSGSWSRSYRVLQATVRILAFILRESGSIDGYQQRSEMTWATQVATGVQVFLLQSPPFPLFWHCFLPFTFQYNFLSLYLPVPWDCGSLRVQAEAWSLEFTTCLLHDISTHEIDPFLYPGKKKEWLY